MKGITALRRTQVKVQERESGTVQEDTEFTKAVDKWLEVEDHLQNEIGNAKKSTAIVDEEAEEAAIHSANLLRSAHKKRHWSSSGSSGSSIIPFGNMDVMEDEYAVHPDYHITLEDLNTNLSCSSS
jgi:hypothetical protein